MNLDFIKEIDSNLYNQIKEMSLTLDNDIAPVILCQSIFHVGLKLFISSNSNAKDEFPDWVNRNWTPSLSEIIKNNVCIDLIKQKLKHFDFEFLRKLNVEYADVDKHEGFVKIDDNFRILIFKQSYLFCSDLYFNKYNKEAPELFQNEIQSLCGKKCLLSESTKKSEYFKREIESNKILIHSLNIKIDELQETISALKDKIELSNSQVDIELSNEQAKDIKNSLEVLSNQAIVINDTYKATKNIGKRSERLYKYTGFTDSYVFMILIGLFCLLSCGGLIYLMTVPIAGWPFNSDYGFNRIVGSICLCFAAFNTVFIIPNLILRITTIISNKKIGIKHDFSNIVGVIFLGLLFSFALFIGSTIPEFGEALLLKRKNKLILNK